MITVYAFFATLLTFGMAIALIVHLRKPAWTTASILVFDLMFYLDRIIVQGRRAAMVELGLMLLMGLWLSRRWLPPRWAMVAVLVIGTLVINSIGEYRATMLGEDRWKWTGAGISEVMEIDYLGNLENLINGEAPSPELTNAVMIIDSVDRQMKFDFGFSHWNALVQRYVPGQFVGADRKEALMIEYGGIAPKTTSALGITSTGLADTFQSFWYFGAIGFFFIGLIMSRWYRAALRGNVGSQILLLLIVPPSLHAITHSTHWFFVYFVQLAAFLLPVLMLARGTRQPRSSLTFRGSFGKLAGS